MQWAVLAALFPLLVGWMNPLADVTREGLSHYQAGEYDQAIQSYVEAELRAPEDPRLAFSRGAINYKMGKYDEALAEFEKALATDDPKLRADVQYNMGNVKFKQEDYPAAIQKYIAALKLNPDHADAKFNLELARKRLKEQLDKNKQQQQQQQQEKQEKQEKQDQQQDGQDQQQPSSEPKKEQDQEKQQQQKQAQEKKDQEQQQQAGAGEPKQDQEKSASEQKGQQPPPQKAEEISPEEAERILRNLARDEMEKRRDMGRKQAGRAGNPEKDW